MGYGNKGKYIYEKEKEVKIWDNEKRGGCCGGNKWDNDWDDDHHHGHGHGYGYGGGYGGGCGYRRPCCRVEPCYPVYYRNNWGNCGYRNWIPSRGCCGYGGNYGGYGRSVW